MLLGQKLKYLRKEMNNITQEDFSKLAGINRATYARYETNANQPDYETLKHIARIFGVTVHYLLDDELDLLEVFEDKHLTIVAGGKQVTPTQRVKILEVLQETAETEPETKPTTTKVYKLPELIAADANSGYGVGEAPSPELIELMKVLVNDAIEEREKRSRKKTTE